MKTRKIRRFISFAFAMTACLSLIAGNVYAVEDNSQEIVSEEPIPPGTIPEWIPKNFDDTVSLYNEYGATCIKDDVVCFIRDVSFSSSNYTYKLDFDEDSSVQDWLSCETYSDTSYNFEVICFAIPADSNLIYTSYNEDSKGVKREVYTFNFVSDSEGNITETDILGWIPDSVPEYDAFIQNNGNVSLHDDYIVYCNDVNYSTGVEIIFEQLGTAEIEEIYSEDVKKAELQMQGNKSHIVKVYKAVSEGTIKVNWTVAQPWNVEQSKESEEIRYFKVDDTLSVSEITEEEFNNPIPVAVRGDANDDGEFDISDAVMLCNWLLGNGELTCWENVDLCKDDRIDVFDFCILKSEVPLEPKQ